MDPLADRYIKHRMDDHTKVTIRSIFAKRRRRALVAFNMALRNIYFPELGAAPLTTRPMVQRALRLAVSNCERFIEDCVAQVPVADRTPDSFGLLQESTKEHCLALQGAVEAGLGRPYYADAENLVFRGSRLISKAAQDGIQAQLPVFKAPVDKGGRTEEWGWNQAEADVLAQFPDGIPEVRGMKSRIADLLAIWFVNNFDSEPSRSQRMKRARKLYEKYGSTKVS